MADLEQSLEELDGVKQSFKANINNAGISTSNVEFRNMPNLINQMEKKLPLQNKRVTPTKEVQAVVPDAGYRLQQVDVNPIPDEYIVPTGVKIITENGSYDVSDFATAQVEVEGESATLISKEITENGTYNATDDNADGYSSVVVNIESSGGGGEEVIQETYAGSQLATYYAKIRELVASGKLLNVQLKFLSNVETTGYGKGTISTTGYTTETYSYTFSSGDILTGSSGKLNASSVQFVCVGEVLGSLYMNDSRVLVHSYLLNQASNGAFILGKTSKKLDVSTFSITLNYFA